MLLATTECMVVQRVYGLYSFGVTGCTMIYFCSCLSWRSIKTFLQLSAHVIKLYYITFLIINKFQNQTFLQVPHVETSIGSIFLYLHVCLFVLLFLLLVIKAWINICPSKHHKMFACTANDLHRVVPRYGFPFFLTKIYCSSLGWLEMSMKSTQPIYYLLVLLFEL